MKPLHDDSSFQRLTATPRGRRLLEQELLLVSAAELISDRMQEKKVTRAELAARMGTGQSTIARLESGQTLPSTKTLLRYAEATGSKFHVRLSAA